MVRKFFEVIRSSWHALARQKVQAGAETIKQRGWTGAGLPGERSPVPALFEVQVVVRIRNTDPADEGWLNPFTSTVREIEVTDTFRSHKPLVTRAGGTIYDFGFVIRRNH